MHKSTASVCMATYNGEKFIVAQLHSILEQIGLNDEVIIVDDSSVDGTVHEIEKINDSRVKVIVLQENVGHVRAFEEALRNATNDIIFFADQDDIWCSDKYSKVLEKFKVEIPPCLVVHSLSAINEDSSFLSELWLPLKAARESGIKLLIGELLKPRVFGSAAAFKRSILKIMLPFPKGVYAHDHWLTICAGLTGKSDFMSDNLVYRRIHNNNVTPVNGLSYFFKIHYRLIFAYLVLVGWFRLVLRRYQDAR